MNETTREFGAAPDSPTDHHSDHRSGLHELHVTHLVMGIAFTGIALLWLLSVLSAVPDADLRLLVPLPFLFAGALGLLAVVLGHRRRG